MSDPAVIPANDHDIRESLLAEDRPMDQVAARRRLAELSIELGLPMLPDVLPQDASADVIREAVAEQVDCVESRVPKMKAGILLKMANRSKMVMPLYFHTPVGKETVRRFVMNGRFSRMEMALILGVREGQLTDFITGQGWNKDLSAIERARDIQEWKSLTRHGLHRAKAKIMEGAIKAIEDLVDRDTAARDILSDPSKLRLLHEIVEKVDPPTEGERIDYDNLPTVNVGVQIVSHGSKAFNPAEAAKRARAAEVKPVEPPQIED